VEKPGEERERERVTENDTDLDRTWGMAPPYGAYRGRYSDYDLGQTGSMGSGQLGGWSGVGSGGFFDVSAPTLPRTPERGEHEPLSVPEE
jgi:hypothetical protein